MTIIPQKAAPREAVGPARRGPDDPAGGRDRAVSALRDRGLRRTRPREVVPATDSHPTAEQVHGLVRRRLPRVLAQDLEG